MHLLFSQSTVYTCQSWEKWKGRSIHWAFYNWYDSLHCVCTFQVYSAWIFFVGENCQDFKIVDCDLTLYGEDYSIIFLLSVIIKNQKIAKKTTYCNKICLNERLLLIVHYFKLFRDFRMWTWWHFIVKHVWSWMPDAGFWMLDAVVSFIYVEDEQWRSDTDARQNQFSKLIIHLEIIKNHPYEYNSVSLKPTI